MAAQLGSPWWELTVVPLDDSGAPSGPVHTLGDDAAFAGWEVQFSADWSPDGKQLVFDGCEAHFMRCGIYRVPVGASGAATGPPVPVLTHDADRTSAGDGVADESYGAPSWSPDGRFVSFIHRTGLNVSFSVVNDPAGSRTTLERLPVAADGHPTGPPAVISDLEPAGGFYEASPDWAPDSRAIAFYANVHPLTGEHSAVDVVVPLGSDGLPSGPPNGLPTLLSPHGWSAQPPVWGPPTPEPPPGVPPATPSDAPPAAPGPAPSVPCPSSAPPPSAAVEAATLPSARTCISRRAFRIRLARPAGDPLVQAVVTVNGRRVKVVRGRRLVAPVDLRGLPKGRVKVAITAVTRSGRRLSAARTYRTCTAKRRANR